MSNQSENYLSLEEVFAIQFKPTDLYVALKEKKDMTLTELSLFRGTKDSAGLLYVACKGDIFDLTGNRKIFT